MSKPVKNKLYLRFQDAEIRGNDIGFVVQHWGDVEDKKTGEVTRKLLNTKHFYSTLGQCLTHILHHKLAHSSEIRDIESLLKKLHEIEAEMKKVGISK